MWHETKQKAATVGMCGLTPYRGQANGYKSRKRVFAIISPLTCHGGSRSSPLTSLTVSEKKSLREKKVGSAEKKHACRFFLSNEFIKLLRVLNLPSPRAGLRVAYAICRRCGESTDGGLGGRDEFFHVAEDFGVVECQWRELVDGKPLRFGCIVAGYGFGTAVEVCHIGY